MIFVLCDKINSGKSSFISSLAQRLIDEGRDVGGVFTPAHIEGKQKCGHDLCTISNGTISPPIEFTRERNFENSFQFGRYHFSSKAFDVANVLDANCDIFIIDEIGPLETVHRQGFFDLLIRAHKSADKLLIVMREDLALPDAISIPAISFKLGDDIPL